MTGFTEAELYDKDFRFDALLTPKSRLVAEQRFRARQNGEVVPAQYETQIQSKSGEVHDVEVSTVSIGTADKVLVMGIIRNITERKRAQTILKRNEHELQLKNEGIAGAQRGVDRDQRKNTADECTAQKCQGNGRSRR